MTNKNFAKRLRFIRKIGNSYYIKLEPADIKDFSIDQESEALAKVKVDISDIMIIKLKKKRK